MSVKMNNGILSIIILLAVFVSDDTLLFGTNINIAFYVLKFALYGFQFFLILVYIYLNNLKISRQNIVVLLMMILLIIATCVFNLDFKFGYIYRILTLVIGFLMASIVSFQFFSNFFSKIMILLSSFSLVTFLIEIFSKNSFSLFPIITNTANNHFYNMLFSVVPVENWGVPRNYGIFREPGVYIIFLVMALTLELFVTEKKNIYGQLIFVVTILTTRSTTGYIGLIIVYVIYAFKKTSGKLDLFKKTSFILVGIVAAYYLMNYTELIFSDNQYISVFGKFSNSSDTIARYASIVINIFLFLNSPIVGNGITTVDKQFPILTLQRYGFYSEHNTNTTLIQFSIYGLFFSLIWLFLFVTTIKKYDKNIFIVFGIFLLFQLLFVGENISNNVILSIFLFLGISNREKK